MVRASDNSRALALPLPDSQSSNAMTISGPNPPPLILPPPTPVPTLPEPPATFMETLRESAENPVVVGMFVLFSVIEVVRYLVNRKVFTALPCTTHLSLPL